MVVKGKANSTSIAGVDVYLELRKNRTYVGRLTMVKDEAPMEVEEAGKTPSFLFRYDDKYVYKKAAIPLGPDLPLTKKEHTSPHLFRTLNDRIPSSKNPSYKDYCETMGISVKEKNPLVLLSTIGRRGPSSFVFEPVYNDTYSIDDYKNFRRALRLTIRDFASLFDISVSTLIKMEGNRSGKDVLKRISIYDRFPDVALAELSRRGAVLNENKKQTVFDVLSSRLKTQPENSKPPRG